ncbi:transposase [Gorillibacterium sp. sgz5001074]|uniref:transposase n=1 Tax=Gorillibacterium sp. sgz5001074 TaxID=3446695 RepID=UPI003F672642
MALLIVAGTVLIPLAMWGTSVSREGLRSAYDLLALAAALTFGIWSGLAVYGINRHHTVLTTEIHKLFLDPWFLSAGAYLGLYGIYRILAEILLKTWERRAAAE